MWSAGAEARMRILETLSWAEIAKALGQPDPGLGTVGAQLLCDSLARGGCRRPRPFVPRHGAHHRLDDGTSPVVGKRPSRGQGRRPPLFVQQRDPVGTGFGCRGHYDKREAEIASS